MNARLKVLHDKANVKSVKLLPITVIGRSTECDLKIASSEVSRIHCRITVNDEAVYIEDLGSANGTLLNGQLLNPRHPTLVEPGGKLSIGPAEFLVDYTAPTSNTVVVRRSDSSGKPTPQSQRMEAESEGKELIFSSMPENTEESAAEATLCVLPPEKIEPIKAMTSTPPLAPIPDVLPVPVVVPSTISEPALVVPKALAQPVPEVVRRVPAAPSIAEAVAEPVVAAPPVIVSPPAAAALPVETAAVAKAVAAIPMAAAVARAVPVAASPANAVPTARAVPVQSPPVPRAAPIAPPVERPIQVAAPAAKSPPIAAPKAANLPQAPVAEAPAFPQFMAPEQVTEASEPVDSFPPMGHGLQFDLGTTPEPRRSAKPTKTAKAGGLKSLLSVFGGRKAAPAKPAPTAVEPEEEPPAAAAVPVVPGAPAASAPSGFSFGFAGPDADAAEESTEPASPDDDFQNFLRQF